MSNATDNRLYREPAVNIDNGGPAFPVIAENGLGHIADGMTLRDYFAAKAMAAFMTGCESFDEAILVAAAFRMADLMIAARST